ncbi:MULTISPECIES: hypothetical protein [Elizabethkingia]|uniref:Uncharacterized protein n=3 Tax=Elizabethkingia anophelis TaxID=1117645 RepID=A0A1T3DPE0_9FLAO|nr:MULTISPECIES: hypothetical protein [Elizabethkingia]AMR40741.1 hypothetical protein A2T74_04905 [Elizabethkingia anophelis]AMX47377.1 hypothetical protein A4C56_04905 [Elizabethkingia anophelis]AMX50837.1 hypothetical protein A2T72_04905 [Elizabethkingia anophelis]AMX54229.1 hypothetical protein A2T59_04905 [Elizabethkingia anophelis]AQW92208.1 hypothetical protein BBD28_16850 [Elizabethkingia anophelis]
MLFRYPKYSKEDKTGELIFTDNRYFVMAVVIAILVFMLIWQLEEKTNDENIRNASLTREMDYSVFDRIIGKGKDKSNRDIPYIVLSNKKQEYISSNLWDCIEKGDSISKKEGEQYYYIFRGNKVIKYDLYISYKKLE